MNGILIVDKPAFMTSRDVVNILSKKFHTKKVGHAGTLDPMATGVLVVAIGSYTKLLELVTGYEKEYEFEACLGVSTDTFDIEGTVLEEKAAHYTSDVLDAAMQTFPKCYLQEVPIYSAVKINGKKLYQYARNHEEVVLPKREVEIKSFSLLEMPVIKDNHTFFKGKVLVSKGTYIRSLIVDFAHFLNTIGTMSALRRVKQGDFTIEEAYSLDQILNDEYTFISLNRVFQKYPKYELSKEEYEKVKNGCLMEFDDDSLLFTYQGQLVALYKKYEKNPKFMKPWKML